MHSSETLSWPPPYSIKKHRRARHVKLRAIKPGNLEITVPYRFDLGEIPSILEEKRKWITKQLLDLQSRQYDVLPDKIAINMANEVWSVHYMACHAKLDIIQRPTHEIVLIGSLENHALCKEKLITWLKAQAKRHLVARINILSEHLQLDFASVAIRDQKSLWGSCTREKAISLNYKLMFLPKQLAEHVIIHELCHTKHLNHSAKFWNLVAKCDPAWEWHKRELRRADKFIPDWI